MQIAYLVATAIGVVSCIPAGRDKRADAADWHDQTDLLPLVSVG